MIAYPHVRQLERLLELYATSWNELRSAATGVPTLMAVAKTASYHHAIALGDEDDALEDLRDRYAISLPVALRSGSLSPQIALLLCGLGSYVQSDHRRLLFDPDRRFFGDGRFAQRRCHVRRLWSRLMAAVGAAADGDGEAALQQLEGVATGLRSTRLTREIYFSLSSLRELLSALILSDGVTAAWRAREMHIFTITAKRQDLYHPAGLLDLHALAIADVVDSEAERPPFVPARNPWISRPVSVASGL